MTTFGGEKTPGLRDQRFDRWVDAKIESDATQTAREETSRSEHTARLKSCSILNI